MVGLVETKETFDLIIKQTYDLVDQFAICIASVISVFVFLFKGKHLFFNSEKGKFHRVEGESRASNQYTNFSIGSCKGKTFIELKVIYIIVIG